jgi:hypothetical protein
MYRAQHATAMMIKAVKMARSFDEPGTTSLTEAGYAAKQREGRRNRYQIQACLPLPGPASQQPTIGELLDLLTSQRETTEHS